MEEIKEAPLVVINNKFYADLSAFNPDAILHRQVKKAKVQLIDSRNLSSNQRKMCYALMRAIADWSGTETTDIKELFKLKFLTENVQELGDTIFSLSDAPMSLIASFQKYLIKFIVENAVPVNRPLIDYVEDIKDYTYQCLINKVCAVCGKKADLHHIDRVGLGRDRTEIIHEGMEAISLCRVHHEEAHAIGEEFFKKWHLDGGIPLDKTLCKIYRLKEKK